MSAGGHEHASKGFEQRTDAGMDVDSVPRDETLQHPRCVLQILKRHFARYTPEMVERVCGVPPALFDAVADAITRNSGRDRTTALVYAVGWTHHTSGVQMIRAGAILQLLLGNVGRPGGGVNAERGHANIQGNTDNAISWEIFPGYLAVPKPEMATMADYMAKVPSKQLAPGAINFFGVNYRKFMVSQLKAWYGDAAQPDNDFRYAWYPKPAKN